MANDEFGRKRGNVMFLPDIFFSDGNGSTFLKAIIKSNDEGAVMLAGCKRPKDTARSSRTHSLYKSGFPLFSEAIV